MEHRQGTLSPQDRDAMEFIHHLRNSLMEPPTAIIQVPPANPLDGAALAAAIFEKRIIATAASQQRFVYLELMLIRNQRQQMIDNPAVYLLAQYPARMAMSGRNEKTILQSEVNGRLKEQEQKKEKELAQLCAALKSTFSATLETLPCRPWAAEDGDNLYNPQPIVEYILEQFMEWVQPYQSALGRIIPKVIFSNHSKISTCAAHVDVVTRVFQLLRHIRLVADRAADAPMPDYAEQHGGLVGRLSLSDFLDTSASPELREQLDTFQSTYDQSHEMTLGGPPELTQAVKFKMSDKHHVRYGRAQAQEAAAKLAAAQQMQAIATEAAVKVMQAAAAVAQRTPAAASHANANMGAGSAPGANAGAGNGAAAGAGANNGARGGGAGRGGILRMGTAAWAASPLPSRAVMAKSLTGILPPCTHCHAQNPSWDHPPEACTRNPANFILGQAPALPPQRCWHCGGARHQPCNATALERAAFALTPAGQRATIWRNSKVPRHSRTVPHELIAAHAHSTGVSTIIIDGGATRTCMPEEVPLEDRQMATGVVQGVGKDTLSITGRGVFRHGRASIPALSVKGLRTGLISETEVQNSDQTISVITEAALPGQHVKRIIDGHGNVLFEAQEAGGMYVLEPPAALATSGSQGAMNAEVYAHTSQAFYAEHREYLQLHAALRHPSRQRMEHILKTQAIAGLPSSATLKRPPADWKCLICQLSKMRMTGHAAQAPQRHTATHRSSDIYFDIIIMPNGQYGLHARDQWSGYHTVDVSDKKGTAAEFCMQRVHQRHERDKALGGVVRVHTDIDRSMLTNEFKQYLKDIGATLVQYAPYDEQSHGFSERLHSDMWAGARCNLRDWKAAEGEDLPPDLYQWALQHAITGINCMPRGEESHTPYELEHDRKPRADHLLRFGQPVVILVRPKPDDKRADRGMQGRHVGMTEGSETLHLVICKYSTKTGMIKTRCLTSRTISPIFDDLAGAHITNPTASCDDGERGGTRSDGIRAMAGSK